MSGTGMRCLIRVYVILAVLGFFIPQLVLFHNQAYNTTLTADHFHSYHFCDVWGGTNEEAHEKVAAFFASEWFADIPRVDGAYQALSNLRAQYDFAIVTSRQHAIEGVTREWLKRHFNGIFCDVVFGNHY